MGSSSTNPFFGSIPSARESTLQYCSMESASTPAGPLPHSNAQNEASLRSRYPGDMSHRPLDMIRCDAKTADRGSSSRHRRIASLNNDLVDSLDKSGPFGVGFHHEGPYDATLVSRNRDPIYSPVAAVRESNMAALQATPKEYIRDSLHRHVPLQGTATIPPGCEDLGGNIMSYEEGADLMREDDAPGGPYKRWHHNQYHPDDLKGKGEPSYTIERDLKAAKGERRRRVSTHEMNPFITSHERSGKEMPVRQSKRNVSIAEAEADSPPESPMYMYGGDHVGTSSSSGVHWSNTHGKRFGGGLKRTFGGMGRGRAGEGDGVSA